MLKDSPVVSTGKELEGRITVFGTGTSIFTDKQFDTKARKFLGYSISASICSFMVVTTSASLIDRLQNDSNFDLITSVIDSRHDANIIFAQNNSVNTTSNIMKSMLSNTPSVHNGDFMVDSCQQFGCESYFLATDLLTQSVPLGPSKLVLQY